LYEKGKTNRGEASIHGVAVYDTTARELISLDWLAEGGHWLFQPYDKERQPFVAAFQWIK
jgi:hypothetical protein